MNCSVKILVFFLSTLTVSGLYGQIGIPYYEFYQLNDYYDLYPAYAGFEELGQVGVRYRGKFGDGLKTPENFYFSVHGNFFNRVGLGIKAYSDVNGAVILRGAHLTFAYAIPISERFKGNDKVSFGLSLNSQFLSFDNSRFNPRDPNDPLINIDSKYYPYLNLSVFSTFKGIRFGMSVLNIDLGNNTAIVNGIETSHTYFSLLGGYKIDYFKKWRFEPSLNFLINSRSEILFDVNLSADYLMDDFQYLTAGISYRRSIDSEFTQSLQIIPHFGFHLSRYSFYYGYNTGLSEINSYTGATHLLSLTYLFKINEGR